MNKPDFIAFRLIKNPESGVKDTVVGFRKFGEVVSEDLMLIDNPIYLQWLSEGNQVTDDMDE